MSAHPNYNASDYQENRPRYNPSLIDTVLALHRKNNPDADTDLAVDIATGTGIFARQLSSHFKRVVGTDISAEMLQSARDSTTDSSIEYIATPSEDLSVLETGSVDVMTVATAAHWFDIEAFIKEAKRVLKPSGTLAIFGYNGIINLVDYPHSSKILKEYYLNGDRYGYNWGAGYFIVANGYRIYHQALEKDGWSDIERRIFPDTIEGEPSAEYPPIVETEPIVVDFKVTWQTLQNYLLTSSAVTQFVKQHPERENPAKAVTRKMMSAAGTTDMDEKLNTQWEQVLLTCHLPRTSN
ncbi:trans-aconitate methyltransferase 1 [Coemansia guatemalensis]|uniref:Trans-aconitate methyltransferase 1 n=1 Tax=Coemansia guatemalensis TaxID=2761395 RepID=A0A9W8HZS8_9FUNG|nr:trans-aconitate methyltransferase 1 [Coemansia guatemalensis]